MTTLDDYKTLAHQYIQTLRSYLTTDGAARYYIDDLYNAINSNEIYTCDQAIISAIKFVSGHVMTNDDHALADWFVRVAVDAYARDQSPQLPDDLRAFAQRHQLTACYTSAINSDDWHRAWLRFVDMCTAGNYAHIARPIIKFTIG